MKRILSIGLSLIIALTALLSLPFVADAAVVSGNCGDNGNNVTWSFNTDTGVLTLSGSGNTANYNDDASPAPWINNYASSIKRVVIQPGVEGIGSKAFMNCTALQSVDFGTVKYIGWYAFNSCTSLGSVSLPDTLLQTWSGCFQNCTSIGWISIGSGLTSLCPYMFAGCNSNDFWWVHIPENIKTIEEHAFDGCKSLGWNTIAGTGVTFGQDCFKNINYEGTFLIADAATREYLQGYADYMNTPEYDGEGNMISKPEYKWKYDCYDGRHNLYTASVVNPTCTEQGYTIFRCTICDNDIISDYVEELWHNYELQGFSTTDYYINYKCERCNQTDAISALTLKDWFVDYINDKQTKPKFKKEYDVNNDGVINTRDYSLIINQYGKLNSGLHQTTVNKTSTHQVMYGFGASACWWSQFVGGWNDEKVNEVMKMLYDDEEGIGLNVYRYNLGAGSQDDNALGIARRAECFIKSDGTYDWNADANARNCLAVANSYCDNMRVTLFSNSPVIYYTKNGRAFCDSSSPCNIDSKNYVNHANYVVTCGEHFTNLGYRVTDISPINEPEWDWVGGQEGCHYSPEECREMYKQCIYKIRASTINSTCEISMFESGKMSRGHADDWAAFNDYVNIMLGSDGGNTNLVLRSYFKNIGFHSYWSGQIDREATATFLNNNYSAYGKMLTEFCQMDGSSSGLGMYYALDLADTIWQDLTILDAKEWDWWTAVAEGGYMDGLLYTDYTNESSSHEIITSKRYWVMGNFSKYTTEGSVRIDVNCNQDMKTCGFKNPDGSITLIYINTTNNDEATFVSGTGLSTYSTYTTDATRNLQETQANESVSTPAIIPANSVTTVVLK